MKVTLLLLAVAAACYLQSAAAATICVHDRTGIFRYIRRNCCPYGYHELPILDYVDVPDSECPSGFKECEQDKCFDLAFPNDVHCGSCDHTCVTGLTCQFRDSQDLHCDCIDQNEVNCGTEVSPECVNFVDNEENCGECGFVCDTELECVYGECVCPDPTLTNCGGVHTDSECVDLTTSEPNCGACDYECASPLECDNSACHCPTMGDVNCGTDSAPDCSDLQTDEEDCGMCDHTCDQSQLECQGGYCVCSDPALDNCGTDDSANCVDHQTDNSHCGTCDHPCDAADHRHCEGGVCVCDSPYVDCHGVCTDVTTDINCGVCDNDCDVDHDFHCINAPGSGYQCACAQGKSFCTITAVPIYDACISLNMDNGHCGQCNAPCPMFANCINSLCICDAGLSKCSGQCVDKLTSNSHCGSCGNNCPVGSTCQNGACVCTAPNHILCSGACADITQNTHCGTCSDVCDTGNFFGCRDTGNSQYGCTCNLGGNASSQVCDNVCVDIKSNAKHCSRCFYDCGAGKNCVNSVCVTMPT